MTQHLIDDLTAEEYSFFLAYGCKDDDELMLIEFINEYFHGD